MLLNPSKSTNTHTRPPNYWHIYPYSVTPNHFQSDTIWHDHPHLPRSTNIHPHPPTSTNIFAHQSTPSQIHLHFECYYLIPNNQKPFTSKKTDLLIDTSIYTRVHIPSLRISKNGTYPRPLTPNHTNSNQFTPTTTYIYHHLHLSSSTPINRFNRSTHQCTLQGCRTNKIKSHSAWKRNPHE